MSVQRGRARRWRGIAAVFACAGALAAPRAAHAQIAERLSLSVHLGAGTMLSAPQRDEFGLGGAVEFRPGIRVVGPLSLHLMLSLARWTVDQSPTGETVGDLMLVGGGLRIAPEVSRSVGGPFVDLDAAFSITGTVGYTRFGYQAGLGWLFPIGRYLSIGPSARIGQVLAVSEDDAAGRGTATYWRAGLEIELHGPRGEAAPPPPADTDGDGILDPSDRCVTQPETVNQYQDEDGCPDDPDADHDGVLDPTDRCPTQPETVNNFEDADGCPDDPDPDHDGVLNPTDQCPAQPETRNGFQDEDGCPDEAPAAPPAAVVVDDHITINQVVLFDHNRATLQAASNGILDAVVTVLREHPEIRVIRVEGHADDTGTESRNLRLSRDRAKAVQRYIVRARIARGRVTAQGFGSTRPLVQGDTPEAHERNRRVEFVIVEPASGAAPAAAATPAAAPAAEPAAPAAPRGRHHGRGRGRHH